MDPGLFQNNPICHLFENNHNVVEILALQSLALQKHNRWNEKEENGNEMGHGTLIYEGSDSHNHDRRSHPMHTLGSKIRKQQHPLTHNKNITLIIME